MSRDQLRAAYDRISDRFPDEWDVQLTMQASVGTRVVKRHTYDRFANKAVVHRVHRSFEQSDLTLYMKIDDDHHFVEVASLSDADMDEAVTLLLHEVKMAGTALHLGGNAR